MIIITKTTVATRSVSLEQIAAMVIKRQQLLTLKNSLWCHNFCTSSSKNKQNRFNSNSNQMCDFRTTTLCQRQRIFSIFVIGLIFVLSCPGYVSAASKTAIRSIASHEQDPHQLHVNWLEYQRQNTKSTTKHTQHIQPNFLSPDLGNIFSQLGFLIQSRQRNATELAEHIFFKYFNR